MMLQDALREWGLWTRAGINALVCKSPLSFGARLVAADWFDENGQPERAELVRVQVRSHLETHRERGYEFACRGRKILARLQARLNRQLWPWRRPRRAAVLMDFGGGFVETLALPADHWLAKADALFWAPGDERDCPPTACPLANVDFTRTPSWPGGWEADPEAAWSGGRVVGFRIPGRRRVHAPWVSDGMAIAPTIPRLFAAEWPGVVFRGIGPGRLESVARFLERTGAKAP